MSTDITPGHTPDRTTPQRRPEASGIAAAPAATDAEGPRASPPSVANSDPPRDPTRDITLDRERRELRPLLGAERDVTVVLPRFASDAAGATPGSRQLPRRDVLALALKPGTTMHEYRIDGVLGEGGFGITYLATDVHLNAAVAIKEYLPQDIVFRAADGAVSATASEHLPRYKQGLESFLQEARTLASFRHRSIVRVARFFEAHRTAYMVLEVEKGEPLKAWWPQHKHIGEKALVELLLPLLDGLAAVHSAGFLHRDIKPDNIQVRASDGSLVLLDFGSAAQATGLAPQGLTVVTPGYAPLEQYGLGEQGPWTDIYALGATLYWAVAGRKPPDAETRKADPRAYSRAVEAGRDVYGDAFLKAIDWALHTDPARRPRKVSEFRRALCADHPQSLQRFDATRQRAKLRRAAPEDTAPGELPAPPPARPAPRWQGWLKPRNWPLAARLAAAMAVAAVLPMALLASSVVRGGEQALVNAESAALRLHAEQAAREVGDTLDEARRLARALATDPAWAAYLAKPTEPARAALRERLLRPVQAGAGVQAALLLDGSGAVVAGTEAQGSSQALRPWFTRAMAGQSYTSTLQAGATPGASHYHVAEPVRGEPGAPVGALVLRLNGDTLTQAVSRLAQDRRLTPFVVDADAVMVQHPLVDLRYRSLVPLPADTLAAVRSDQRYRRDSIDSIGETALWRAMAAAKQPGQVEYASTLSARPAVAGYAPVPGHDWVVAVTADRAGLSAPLQRQQAWLGAGLLAVAAAVALASVLVARGVTKPLRRLQQAMWDLKAGDFEDAHLRADRNDEIGQTARSFNALAENLRLRQPAPPADGAEHR